MYNERYTGRGSGEDKVREQQASGTHKIGRYKQNRCAHPVRGMGTAQAPKATTL